MPSTLETPIQIAQRLIPATTDCVLYTIADNSTAVIIKTIIVCNTTSSGASYSLYVNQNGKVSADAFALCKGLAIAANASDQRTYPQDCGIVLTGSGATILAKASAANAITVTIYGVILETM